MVKGQREQGVVPRTNRFLLCPECGGKLGSDRAAYTTFEGRIFRERICKQCGEAYNTKQEPEELVIQTHTSSPQ